MNRTRGFTLVEVLVALAIVAVGMAALLSALGSAADTTSYLRDKTFAEWIALNRIAELRLQPKKPEKGKTTGEVEFAGRRWMWEQEIKDVDVPGMNRVDVSVRPADAPGARGRTWFTTEAGIYGDAVAPSRGDLPIWPENPGGPGGGPGGDSKNGDKSEPGQPGEPSPGATPEEPPRDPRPPRTRLGT